MEAEKLQKLGLNLSESKVYTALLQLGPSKAGEISKKAQINRTTTYDSLENLIKKGLVSFFISANRKLFTSVSPHRFLEMIKETEITAKELLPELSSIYTQSKEVQEANIFKGKKGIKSILNDILKNKKYVAFGSSGKFLDVMKYDFSIFQKRKQELKIQSRVVLSEKVRNKAPVRESYGKYKFIEDKYSSPIATYVYGNKVSIIVWSEIPVATVITDKKVADSFRNYFEMIWKIAKE